LSLRPVVLALVVATAAAPGCVERELRIESEPPGADVSQLKIIQSEPSRRITETALEVAGENAARGAVLASGPREVAEASDFFLTILTDAGAMQEVYGAILPLDLAGKTVLEMSLTTRFRFKR